MRAKVKSLVCSSAVVHLFPTVMLRFHLLASLNLLEEESSTYKRGVRMSGWDNRLTMESHARRRSDGCTVGYDFPKSFPRGVRKSRRAVLIDPGSTHVAFGNPKKSDRQAEERAE